ncbi:tetratricopeptide repeat protein [Bhargavaea beijingensis]|uniref:Tetratricopeptide repeat protein n=1 Tax=Bhargavaea beijingensis TaxID=426756 RepID=A0A1G7CNL2_9BACL|nr:tetratricopeptide repeat protein [Bhargavaea beijingensis]MCW1927039.1 tetratricopeptide repeat protein [Bhargavaea beijingensis]RSK30769.1 tetratricopeptide repeat protein [Bhargavaea beijingensis]SDE40370.1 Tetratricopeptide repeat-containing protein [Bhargavaea beijingensis]
MDHNTEGIQAIRNEDYEEAVKAFTEAIDANPDDPIGYINFGNLLASIGREEEALKAEKFFQKALALDPGSMTAVYGLAGLYYNLDRYEEAARLYEKAIRGGIEGADAPYMLGKSLERTGKLKLALPYMQRARELSPDDLQIRLSYGILLASLEMFHQAMDELTFVAEHDPDNADAHYNLGVLYAVSTQQRGHALSHLEKAFTISPDHIQAREVYNMISQSEE